LGDFDHASVDDDDELIVLDIEAIHIHPKFDQKAAYFDVAVLETKTVQFSLVSTYMYQKNG
jgi:hypothetical protein